MHNQKQNVLSFPGTYLNALIGTAQDVSDRKNTKTFETQTFKKQKK